MNYLELFNDSLQIIDISVDEDREPIEDDRFSYFSGHYTVPVEYANTLFGFAKCIAIVHIDEQCIDEMKDIIPNTSNFWLNVTQELAISPSGKTKGAEKLVNIIRDNGYDSPTFENFCLLKVIVIAPNYYFVKFSIDFTSDDDTIKQEQDSSAAVEVEMAAYESKLEDRLS